MPIQGYLSSTIVTVGVSGVPQLFGHCRAVTGCPTAPLKPTVWESRVPYMPLLGEFQDVQQPHLNLLSGIWQPIFLLKFVTMFALSQTCNRSPGKFLQVPLLMLRMAHDSTLQPMAFGEADLREHFLMSGYLTLMLPPTDNLACLPAIANKSQ